jgi:hypothetical protein
MPSLRERTFRDTIATLLATGALPPWLVERWGDHLHRTDAAGLSLCYANAERWHLLDVTLQGAYPLAYALTQALYAARALEVTHVHTEACSHRS